MEHTMQSLQETRNAAYTAFLKAKKGRCRIALADADAALKAASKALVAMRASLAPPPPPPPPSAEGYDAWARRTMFTVWYCEHQEWPAYLPDAYFASREDAIAASASDEVVRSAEVRAISKTALEVWGAVALFAMYEETRVNIHTDDAGFDGTSEADLIRMGLIEE